MKEEWRPVEGTNNYLYVSNLGRVRSNWRKGKILKPTPDQRGYLRLKVTTKYFSKPFKVHRLVAQAFIPNPDNLPQVNHIDGNKANNRVDNLEWMSNRDNAHHAIRTGLWTNSLEATHRAALSKRIPLYSIDIITGERRDFESVSKAERFFNSRHISDVLNGKRNKAAGQHFYKKEGDSNGSEVENSTD